MTSTESHSKLFGVSILLFFLAGVFAVFAGEVVQLRILQTADIHACVDQTPLRQASWLQLATIVEDPLKAVVRGTGVIMKNLKQFKSVLMT